ncbi:hypothetical protein [Nocardia flavorosea]|uniref:hypothetical protein n=1 Tax=Nocardia flavorosea TaxID=53429 RepID=UPI0007A3FB6C|nr:hypothetical protein [Nocardia flavorosea]
MGLKIIRAGVVSVLPFVDQVWQIYVLIAILHTASAAFTPTYQAVIPDILPGERDYTRALSAAQLAATRETLLSPMPAAAALALISFHWLFVGTAIGFVISAILVVSTRIPDAGAAAEGSFRKRIAVGMRIFLSTPRLRGVLALNLVIATAGSIAWCCPTSPGGSPTRSLAGSPPPRESPRPGSPSPSSPPARPQPRPACGPATIPAA